MLLQSNPNVYLSTEEDAKNDGLVEELRELINSTFVPRNRLWYKDLSVKPHDLPDSQEMKELLAANRVLYLREHDKGPVVAYY